MLILPVRRSIPSNYVVNWQTFQRPFEHVSSRLRPKKKSTFFPNKVHHVPLHHGRLAAKTQRRSPLKQEFTRSGLDRRSKKQKNEPVRLITGEVQVHLFFNLPRPWTLGCRSVTLGSSPTEKEIYGDRFTACLIISSAPLSLGVLLFSGSRLAWLGSSPRGQHTGKSSKEDGRDRFDVCRRDLLAAYSVVERCVINDVARWWPIVQLVRRERARNAL